MNSRRSWIVLAGGILAYVVGVTQRTSFGIAGVDATARFDTTAAAVSSIAVAQIIVYAALQIPVGVLLDRLGSTRLIVAGALVMAVGQALLAVAPGLGVALAARILLGVGDALTFVSVLRLLPAWFSGSAVPALSQAVGSVGQLGQLLSAVPFALLLDEAGWTPSFLVLAATGLVTAALVLAAVRDGTLPPATGPVSTVPGLRGTLQRVGAAMRRPGTQLGFFAHMAAGTPATLMAVLWGYPFLTAALDYPIGLAAGVMSMLVVGNLVAGPVIGFVIARFPLRRSNVVFAVLTVLYGVWAAVLLWPTAPPLALVMALFVLIGVGGPGSLVGVDLARTFNPSSSLGVASGVVNVGGFLGAFVGMFLIGTALDGLDAVRTAAGAASDLYALSSFRIAFLIPFAISAAAVAGMLVTRRRTRRLLLAERGIDVAPLWVALFRHWRRTEPRA